MTAPDLLALICAALLLQSLAGAGVMLWRRRRAIPAPSGPAVPGDQPVQTGAWPGWRDFRVARREIEDAAGSQCSFYLEPVDGSPLPAFKPGQFLTLSLPVDREATTSEHPRTVTRCYSLSDGPDPAHYRITVKRVPAPADRPELPPGVSSTRLHDHVGQGDILSVKAPAGQFVIDADPSLPTVLIAGGIGITPMMSMLTWCLKYQPQRVVHLYYGLRQSSEHAFKSLLESLAAAHADFHLNVVYSRPASGDVAGRDYQHAGHIDIDLLRRTLPHGRHRFFVCGPPAMMNSLVPALADWGVAREDIHHEAFGPAAPRGSQPPLATSAAAGESIEIRFAKSGRTLTWSGQDASLLDFAERNGVAVESGCRSGNCGSCETRLVSGKVHYTAAPDHDIAQGHCLLCVGTPISPLVLDA